jgi:hypothetical protein
VPDRLFSYQKSLFGYIFEGLGKENVGIFYDHLENFTATWCIFDSLVQFVVIRYIFPVLVCLDQEKSGSPGLAAYRIHARIHQIQEKNQHDNNGFKTDVTCVCLFTVCERQGDQIWPKSFTLSSF